MSLHKQQKRLQTHTQTATSLPSSGSTRRLTFNNNNNLRSRLVMSLLTSRPVVIDEIRSNSDTGVGLLPHELSFIQLLLKLSNGTSVKISETGTRLSFNPGMLIGGGVEHECDGSRAMSYFMEPVLLLAAFCKNPIELKLTGILQNGGNGDSSIYKLKYAGLPIMAKFGVKGEMEVVSRSHSKSTILFKCSIRRQLITLRDQYNQLPGPVKSIRGLVYGFRVTPQLLNRVSSAAKSLFTKHISNVSVVTDLVKRSKSTMPGYGIALYGETTRGVVYCRDGWVGRKEENSAALEGGGGNSNSNITLKRKFDIFNEEVEEGADEAGGSGNQDRDVNGKQLGKLVNNLHGGPVDSPESLSEHVSQQLLVEMKSRSCIDSNYQYLVLGLMALSNRDVSSVLMSSPTPYTVMFMRDLKLFTGTVFRVVESDGDDKIYSYSCMGSGYINLNKGMV